MGSGSNKSSASAASDPPAFDMAGWVWIGAAIYFAFAFGTSAYVIRLGAINEFGRVIHEFDPYFNYRATEYLYWNGWERFSKWFDYMSWYPLGRPIGTTIYPGMQVTAVWIKNHILPDWSINDICCFIPAWYGVVAATVTGLIAYEASIPINSAGNLFTFATDLVQGKISPVVVSAPPTKDKNGKPMPQTLPYSFLGLNSPALECFLCTMGLMAIVPAHLMRSIGGGYDNESVAMTTMVLTFYFWMRSIRTSDSWSFVWGFGTALAYFYMVATWGGYVFVLNLIGVHAVALVAMGRFRVEIWAAYSIFYALGTALAMQVPVVGWTPLKSLEQLGPCAVFGAYQLLFLTEYIRKRQNLTRWQAWKLRVNVFGAALIVFLLAVVFVAPSGYFGPLSSRVRGLFVKHTKTGNPLVDSVAEHQAASPKAYFQYLHHVCSLAPLGFLLVLLVRLSDASSFLVVWGAVSYYFSHKMVRLILLTAPIGCVLAGIFCGRVVAWCISQWLNQSPTTTEEAAASVSQPAPAEAPPKPNEAANTGGGGGGRRKKKKGGSGGGPASQPIHASSSAPSSSSSGSFGGLVHLRETVEAGLRTREGVSIKRLVSLVCAMVLYSLGSRFVPYCYGLAQQLSHPTVIQKARTRDGQVVMIDDYRDAYFWLRDNTPADARVMAWWDYGYQIAGIANRTTIADGNTWNHEHIALLGKALTSELNQGYEISRHWADYILVWAGGGGDDLAKSPHLARIANSVYRDHCPDDPTCRAFGFVDRQGTPSAMMRRSLLYTLHSSGLRPDVQAPPDKFTEVYRSKYGKVRIWKLLGADEESRAWVQDPANRQCDVPGSWFCPGQYPPGLSSILARKKDFAQLEDFNRNGGGGDQEYTQQYFSDLNNPERAQRKVLEQQRQEQKLQQQQKQQDAASADDDNNDNNNNPIPVPAPPTLSPEDEERRKQLLYSQYEDTEQSTKLWELIHAQNLAALQAWLTSEPWVAFLRSADGRGPMWWAFEERHDQIVQYLMSLGVPHDDHDKQGLTPADLQSKSK